MAWTYKKYPSLWHYPENSSTEAIIIIITTIKWPVPSLPLLSLYAFRWPYNDPNALAFYLLPSWRLGGWPYKRETGPGLTCMVMEEEAASPGMRLTGEVEEDGKIRGTRAADCEDTETLLTEEAAPDMGTRCPLTSCGLPTTHTIMLPRGDMGKHTNYVLKGKNRENHFLFFSFYGFRNSTWFFPLKWRV